MNFSNDAARLVIVVGIPFAYLGDPKTQLRKEYQDEFNKYYYDPSTNECLSTCIGLEGKEFSDEINFESTDPAPQPTACKRNCDGKFYNYGTKICIDN